MRWLIFGLTKQRRTEQVAVARQGRLLKQRGPIATTKEVLLFGERLQIFPFGPERGALRSPDRIVDLGDRGQLQHIPVGPSASNDRPTQILFMPSRHYEYDASIGLQTGR